MSRTTVRRIGHFSERKLIRSSAKSRVMGWSFWQAHRLQRMGESRQIQVFERVNVWTLHGADDDLARAHVHAFHGLAGLDKHPLGDRIHAPAVEIAYAGG